MVLLVGGWAQQDMRQADPVLPIALPPRYHGGRQGIVHALYPAARPTRSGAATLATSTVMRGAVASPAAGLKQLSDPLEQIVLVDALANAGGHNPRTPGHTAAATKHVRKVLQEAGRRTLYAGSCIRAALATWQVVMANRLDKHRGAQPLHLIQEAGAGVAGRLCATAVATLDESAVVVVLRGGRAVPVDEPFMREDTVCIHESIAILSNPYAQPAWKRSAPCARRQRFLLQLCQLHRRR